MKREGAWGTSVLLELLEDFRKISVVEYLALYNKLPPGTGERIVVDIKEEA